MTGPEEDAVARALGAFGLWQARGVLLLSLIKIPAGWHMLSVNFAAPSPSSIGGRFWCARPSDQWTVQHWLDYSHTTRITLEGKEAYDACRIYDLNYPSAPTENLPQSYENSTRACDKFEFEQPFPTLVSQWDMVCSRDVLVNVVQLAYLIGIVLGGVCTMLLLKKLSPRTLVLMGVTMLVSAGIGSAFMPLFILHLVLKMLTGLGACIAFSAAFQICFDITDGWQRIVVCVCFEHFWSIGVVTLGWLSDLAGSWINLKLVISAPAAVIILAAKWIPESPRWLISSGKLDEAEKVLRSGAAMNHRNLPSDFQIKNPSPPPAGATLPPLPWSRVAALLVLWVVTVYNYYGALLNMKNIGGPRLPIRTTLGGNLILWSHIDSFVAPGGAEVIGASIGMVLLLRCRPAVRFAYLSALLTLGGVACITSWAIPPNAGGGRGGWALVGLVLLGRVPIATSLAVLSCGGSAELLPVSRRPLTMLALVSCARLLLQNAPFMNALGKYGENVTVSIYGSFEVMGAGAAAFLALDIFCSQPEKQPAENSSRSHTLSRRTVYVVEQPPLNSALCNVNLVGAYVNSNFIEDEIRSPQQQA